jgi:hypothetical protein
MLSFKALTLLLPALSTAYQLKACTDYACSENCVDLSADVQAHLYTTFHEVLLMPSSFLGRN